MRNVLFILGELSDKDIDWIMAVGQRERVAPGTILIQEGKSVGALYLVLDGTLSVSIAAGKTHEVARLGTGEIVGEMSFVDARPASATVKAVESTIVLAIPRAQLIAKLERESDFAARFYRALAMFLAERLRGMDSRVLQGASQPSSGEFDPDELDPHVMDHVHLAGSRFDRILKRMLNE